MKIRKKFINRISLVIAFVLITLSPIALFAQSPELFSDEYRAATSLDELGLHHNLVNADGDADFFYLLGMAKRGYEDTVFIVDKATGELARSFAIGKNYAFGIQREGDALWVASRNKRLFLRKFSLQGELLETYRVSSRPYAVIGMEKVGSTFYFLGDGISRKSYWRSPLG